MNCSQCESALLVEIFGTSNPIRCASCGSVSVPTSEASTQASRFAWRSLWLGLASILLLFLTGLPAIWYGVRSLLQMRFVRTQKGDRKAAVAGIGLGILFGILGSGLAALFGGFVLFFMMMTENTDDPDRFEAIRSTIGSLDIPVDFEIDDARVVRGNFRRVEWQDGFTAEDANGRIRLIQATSGTQIGDAQKYGPRLEFDIHGALDVDSESGERSPVSWMFAGKTRKIIKVSEQVLNGDFRTVRYIGSTEEDKSEETYVLAMSVRENGKYSEEDVKKVFESFEPKDSD